MEQAEPQRFSNPKARRVAVGSEPKRDCNADKEALTGDVDGCGIFLLPARYCLLPSVHPGRKKNVFLENEYWCPIRMTCAW